MRIAIAIVITLTLIFAPGLGPWAAGAAQGQQTAAIEGVARNQEGLPLAAVTVRLRDLVTGLVTATTTSLTSGNFNFSNVPVGYYAIEIVDAADRVIGAAAIAVEAGAVVAGLTVVASTGTLAATAGVVSTVLIIATAAAAAGVVAVVASESPASPSR